MGWRVERSVAKRLSCRFGTTSRRVMSDGTRPCLLTVLLCHRLRALHESLIRLWNHWITQQQKVARSNAICAFL